MWSEFEALLAANSPVARPQHEVEQAKWWIRPGATQVMRVPQMRQDAQGRWFDAGNDD